MLIIQQLPVPGVLKRPLWWMVMFTKRFAVSYFRRYNCPVDSAIMSITRFLALFERYLQMFLICPSASPSRLRNIPGKHAGKRWHWTRLHRLPRSRLPQKHVWFHTGGRAGSRLFARGAAPGCSGFPGRRRRGEAPWLEYRTIVK